MKQLFRAAALATATLLSGCVDLSEYFDLNSSQLPPMETFTNDGPPLTLFR